MMKIWIFAKLPNQTWVYEKKNLPKMFFTTTIVLYIFGALKECWNLDKWSIKIYVGQNNNLITFYVAF